MTAITIMIVLFFIFLMFEGVNSFVFLAIPLFMLAGNVMNETGIANRIINVANTFVGHMRGGLAQVNVVGSMLFAGCSGSALADISGLGSIEIAMMEKSG
jgi:TRAP-type C4-dicarboxylate transport system permease large subunit